MTSRLPSEFWHCRISNTIDPNTKKPSWDEVLCDLKLSDLESQVIQPWKNGAPFFISGVKYSPATSSIQIVHTPKAANAYMETEYNIMALKRGFEFLSNPSKPAEALSGILQGNAKIREQAKRMVFNVKEKTDYTNELLIGKQRIARVSIERRPTLKASPQDKSSKDQRRTTVFISYSHKDMKFKNELETHLTPMMRNGLNAWSDKQIQPGSKWMSEIEHALRDASVAVLLVSPAFLSSEFIHAHELHPILKRAETGGMRILWVYVKHCLYKETCLKDYQAAHSLDKPLAAMRAGRDETWVRICEEIKRFSVIDNNRPHSAH